MRAQFAAIAVIATTVVSGAFAQQAAPPAFGTASAADGDLKIVNFDRLEEDARKILSPGRFAIMGWAGDGWTYRGAGLIQITGKYNHGLYARACGKPVTMVGDWLRTPAGAAPPRRTAGRCRRP